NSPDNNSATVAVAVAPQIPLNTGTTPTTPQTRPHNRPNALPNTGKTYDPLAANGSGLMTFGLATLTGVAGLALRRRYRQTP
ncbi:MAG TPA: LPXTG cell wall anchor domain-containing protein, partial [Marmoricola sp.]|nr:LPXTG cell wall anchor domain-containing protein [Marmoricola sp.]